MPTPDPLTPTRTLGAPLIRLGVASSTMDVARRLDHLGAPEGIAVIASSQTRGRGRADRTWHSPPGAGLYCSVLLRPNIPASQFQPFSISAGLAICHALDPSFDLALQLKWPNDILAKNRKLGGVLITSNLQHTRVSSAIIGFGVNLRATRHTPETAIAMEELAFDATPDPIEVARATLLAITERYAQVRSGDASAALADWPQRLAYQGQQVSLQDGSATRIGTLLSIDPSGALVILGPNGPEAISSGELTRGPRALDK